MVPRSRACCLPQGHTLLAVLEEPKMVEVRALFTESGRFPSRRSWERRLAVLPDTLPGRIACLGRCLADRFAVRDDCGPAGAIDSTVLRANGGVWHRKDREQGVVPHTDIDTDAHWTKSGWHGWVCGWKLHLVVTVGAVRIPLAAELTAANAADNVIALELLAYLPEALGGCSATPATRIRSSTSAVPTPGAWSSPAGAGRTRIGMAGWRRVGRSTSCARGRSRAGMAGSRGSSTASARCPRAGCSPRAGTCSAPSWSTS